MKSKHVMCLSIALVLLFVVGFGMYYSSTDNGNCGCAVPGKYEGYLSPSLQGMKQPLYTSPRNDKFITYANHTPYKVSESFVPLPPSMMDQMSGMRGKPVSKSMNSMSGTDEDIIESPFINYGQ